jgi:hypothetical protein
MQMALLDDYNKDVSGWSRDIKRRLLMKVVQLTAVYSGHATKDLKTSVKKYAGEASKIEFSFPYYMAFVHKGAGRGAGGHKTGLFTRANGSKGKTNPNSMGQMGIKRRAKPWFNPVVAERFPVLADIVAGYHGKKVILNIQKILVN